MMANGYIITVRMLPSYSYSVFGKNRDMVSLAFLLEPGAVAREDDTQLTRPRERSFPQASEAALAEEFVDRIAKIEDLDDKLNSDSALKTKMFKKSAALLQTLHYDMGAYRAFAYDNEKPSGA
jgi:hypothetical protein